jgi:hypothetical protein
MPSSFQRVCRFRSGAAWNLLEPPEPRTHQPGERHHAESAAVPSPLRPRSHESTSPVCWQSLPLLRYLANGIGKVDDGFNRCALVQHYNSQLIFRTIAASEFHGRATIGATHRLSGASLHHPDDQHRQEANQSRGGGQRQPSQYAKPIVGTDRSSFVYCSIFEDFLGPSPSGCRDPPGRRSHAARRSGGR